jgi:hypothetical protein
LVTPELGADDDCGQHPVADSAILDAVNISAALEMQ